MNEKEKLIKNIETFLQGVKRVKNYYEILPEIIKVHIDNDNKRRVFEKTYRHLAEVCETDPQPLFEYFSSQGFLSSSDLSLNSGEYKAVLESINELKMKYGPYFRDLIQTSQNPFLINSVESSVSKDNLLHKIRISRVDGEMVEGQFSASSLIGISSSLLDSLNGVLNEGIFNLDKQKVESFLEISKNLNQNLEKLIADFEQTKE